MTEVVVEKTSLEKFQDPDITAGGEVRASVFLRKLETLWFNTGTLCNLTCGHCYIESSPRNDRLAYLTLDEVREYLDEIERDEWGTREIGFTGGEPFLNPQMIEMLEICLSRGYEVIVLTNGMRPMIRRKEQLLALQARYGHRLTLRVSVDHYTRELHEKERGPRSWAPTIEGIRWLAENGFHLNAAGRTCWEEGEEKLRAGYSRLFAELGAPIDARDPIQLVLFPEMDETVEVPEITTACWSILGMSPDEVMCSSSRMVVKRKGAEHPTVTSCTLLPYDERFEMGHTLAEAAGPVKLNHPHCAKFCVLGGGSCSVAQD
ncbi:MAG: radical SAM protein [Gemmatimonadetes bacterium]|jgi:uncharacterized Fe-S cluster-containing radical SAM superfamily protein|nr:radical SAM protein [Gemmatimonadota bacterium]